MRKSGCREDRQLLSPYQCVQSVDGRHSGLDELLRIASGGRIHGQAVDIHARLRQDLRPVVDRTAQTVKDTAEHILGYAELHAPSEETHLTVGQVDSRRTLKELYEHVASVYLEHLASSCLAAGKLDLSELIVCHAFHTAHEHQRSGYFLYGSVLFWHLAALLYKCIGDLSSQLLVHFLIFLVKRIFMHIFETSDLLPHRHGDQLLQGRSF